MEHLSAEVFDLASTPERALETAVSGLSRTARELGAVEAVVLLAGAKAEMAHHCSVSGNAGLRPLPSGSQQDYLKKVGGSEGPVPASTPLAHSLRETVLPDSQSFLLVPWPARQRALTVIFGFAAAAPPHHSIPRSAVANLNLIGLATWSSTEIARLRTELRTVNGRLAGRKNVERAKGILQSQQGFTEEGAYEYLRGLSRSRRITLVQVAEEVLRGRVGQTGNAPPLRTVA